VTAPLSEQESVSLSTAPLPAVPAALLNEARTEETPQPPQSPAWLTRAEKDYAEAVKLLEAGDKKQAEKRLRIVMKTLQKNMDAKALFGVKEDIDSLLAGLGEYFTGPASVPARSEGLDVSEQELEGAQPADPPISVDEKKYGMPIDHDDPLVHKYIALYTGVYRKRMQDALDRMQAYKPIIERELKAAKLPRELLYLPIAESEFINTAHSRAGAVGLWQFMQTTGRGMGLNINYWVDERRDPEKATRAALKYLKYLYDWYLDWHLALAAYNMGEYGVERKMAFTKSLDYDALSHNKAIPHETENYVPKFMACVLIADNPESFGFTVNKADPVEYDEVTLEKPMDLKIAADCTGVSEQTIRDLNPTVRLWCTPKDAVNYVLRIPKGSKDAFLTASALVKDWTPSSGFVKYRVRRGDFIGAIAKKYKTNPQSILADNKIRDPKRLRTGQVLVIRPGARFGRD
jgi:membrane-bound lytic murein transglycosylase D